MTTQQEWQGHTSAWTRRQTMQRMGAGLLAACGLWALSACSERALVAQPVPAGATVLALGDSLTQGVGAAAAQDFPSLLADSTGWHVVNAGVSGDTSAQALARLPSLLAQYQPELVIVGIGGNDFLRRQSTQATKANVEAIVRACLDAKAQVLLVGVPEVNLLASTGWLKDHAMYAELAQQLGVPLLAGAWSEVLAQERLRSDQVHANAQGYAEFAQLLQARLRQVGLLA
ncbi:GDSL-type esterase/lipase family protein [Lampropedia aestuarii]|nr:GDSL-type esterase/lipase family protein [Lampropedia aestuarii]